MNKEDKKIQEDLVNEMMKVSKTNPDVMIYMQSLMKCYEELEKENKKYKDLGFEHLCKRNEQLENENKQLKKQKNDVVEYIRNELILEFYNDNLPVELIIHKLLRMLGEVE